MGVSLATGITSRSLALSTGAIVIAMAFVPKLAAVLAAMPAPIVGATLIYSACFIVIGGLQLLTSRMLDARRIFAVGIAFIFGLSVEISPDLYSHVPDVLRPIFGSSVSLATVLVVSLSFLFRLGVARRIRFEFQPGPGTFELIHHTIEVRGAEWGMRREVALRADHAINEVVNSAAALNPGLKNVEVSLSFDANQNFDAEVEYEGVPIEIADSAPSLESLGMIRESPPSPHS